MKTTEVTMKLFHIINDTYLDRIETAFSAALLLKHGLIFIDNEGNVLPDVTRSVAEDAINIFGLDNEIWSSTFHKSWKKVATTPIEQLVLEQAIHYFSTYGMEQLGYKAMPVIPCENIISNSFALPNIKAFTVIRVVDDATEKLIVKEYLKNIKAPHKNDIDDLIKFMSTTDIAIDDLKSFELKIARGAQLDSVPTDGQDFLRYVIYKITGRTLLIKDRATINSIKNWCFTNPKDAYKLLSKGNEVELAKIFYRFKPIFLAFKSSEKCAPIINRLRRLAVKYHEPLSGMSAANLMNLISNNRIQDAIKIIFNADNRTLVKLINYANSYANDVAIYHIRNGKSYVNGNVKSDKRNLLFLYDFCYAQLVENCKNKLVNKTYFIPEYIDYTVPVSEKQFIGNIPYGTTLKVKSSSEMIPAIWWENYKGRTDIDLHLSNATSHFGWNGFYSSSEALFSGDMTDADPNAVEAFLINNKNNIYLLSANLYSGRTGTPFKFLFSERMFEAQTSDAPINVEDAMFSPIEFKFIDTNNMSLGFIDGNTFTFFGGELGGNITPDLVLNNKALKASINRCAKMFKLRDFIELCGGKVISEATADTKAIDLEPNMLTAATLFEIID